MLATRTTATCETSAIGVGLAVAVVGDEPVDELDKRDSQRVR